MLRSSQEDWMYEHLHVIYGYFILTIYNAITEVSSIIDHMVTAILIDPVRHC